MLATSMAFAGCNDPVTPTESTPTESTPIETPEETPAETPEETPESTPESTPQEPIESTPEVSESESETEPYPVDTEPPLLINLYDKSTAFGGYISADGTKHPYAGHFTSDYIKVIPGQKIYFGPCNPNQDYQLHGYNASKGIVDRNVQSKLVEEDFFPNSYVIYSYTAPANVSYIRLANPAKYNDVYTVSNTYFGADIFLEYWGEGNTLDLFEKMNSMGYIDYQKEVFTGKRALFLGDSICAANCESGKSYRGWAGRIASSTGMNCVNKGNSGASISTARGVNRVIKFYEKTKGYAYDFIIMHGGVNDAWESAPVGKMSDSFDPKSFNTATFAGGLEELFYNVTKDYPDAKLGYIFNFATPSFNTGRIANMTEYYNVAKKICEKWGIPYLNMYEDKEFSALLNVTSNANLSDYLHPNTAGYDIIYKYIMYWMETLPTHSDVKADPDSYELESFPVKK